MDVRYEKKVEVTMRRPGSVVLENGPDHVIGESSKRTRTGTWETHQRRVMGLDRKILVSV